MGYQTANPLMGARGEFGKNKGSLSSRTHGGGAGGGAGGGEGVWRLKFGGRVMKMIFFFFSDSAQKPLPHLSSCLKFRHLPLSSFRSGSAVTHWNATAECCCCFFVSCITNIIVLRILSGTKCANVAVDAKVSVLRRWRAK